MHTLERSLQKRPNRHVGTRRVVDRLVLGMPVTIALVCSLSPTLAALALALGAASVGDVDVTAHAVR